MLLLLLLALTLSLRWWWLSSTCDVACEVVEGGGGWWGLLRVDTSHIKVPDRLCHRPVTRQNGDGNVTGQNLVTRPRPRDSRTHDPARVHIPVSITTNQNLRPQSLLSRLNNRTPSLLSRMSTQPSSSDKQLGDSDLKPWSANFETERNPEVTHSRLSTESLTEDHSYQKKRKRRLSDCVLKRSTRQRKEPDKVSHLSKQRNQSRPLEEQIQLSPETPQEQSTLLNRLGTIAKFSDNPIMGPISSLTLENRRKDSVSRNLTCPGLGETTSTSQASIQAASRPSSPFDSSTVTLKAVSSTSALRQDHQTTSHPHNGNIFSKENQSTSTKSCLHSTGLQLLRSGRQVLEMQISFLDQLKHQGRLRLPPTGPQPGVVQPEQLPSSSLTGPANLKTTLNILKTNSQLKSPRVTTESSSTTSQSGTLFGEGNRLYSPTHSGSVPFTQPLLCQTGSNTQTEDERLNQHEESPQRAIGLMTKDVIAPAASSVTPAGHVEVPTMERLPVGQPQRIELYGMRPKYLRYNVWDPEGNLAVTSAEWTETAKPLPRPPPIQLMDPIVSKTIAENPDYFKIVTPVKIDVFEDLLRDHPNPSFVKSVSNGLRYGFWPWADMTKPGYPETMDLSSKVQLQPEREKFFCEHAELELAKGRYSPSVGSSLLPGMVCMPIYAVPKPHSTKLRLVNDHSASHFSLNSMIDHNYVTGYPMDNLAQYGEQLVNLRKEGTDLIGPGSLSSWKSDIEGAFRLCPMHPHWQVKQAVRIGTNFYIDRCTVFGSSASPAIFITFNSLVTWIAKHKRRIPFITTYVDDSSGCTWTDDVAFYAPYNKHLPSPQARLLTLWDDLGIPHQEKKQIHGTSIPIIGIQVDPNEMSYTLPAESQAKLLAELELWTSKKGSRHTVRQWQHMAGWMNWCFNVYPLLRPALCNVYNKLRSKTNPAGSVWINNAVRADLVWALEKIKESPGRLLLDSVTWSSSTATFTIFCDACPVGMGFWYPALDLAFYSPTPNDDLAGLADRKGLIFYFEALCVLCALLDACNFQTESPGRFVIYTDSLNTVDIFSSLSALPSYNILLQEAVNLLYKGKHDLRVLHVPGEKNCVADALSRADFDRALQLQPNLTIRQFEPYHRLRSGAVYTLQPPRDTLGASKK